MIYEADDLGDLSVADLEGICQMCAIKYLVASSCTN